MAEGSRRRPLFVAWGRFTDNPWQGIIEAGARDAGFDTVDLEHGARLEELLGRAGDGVVVHFNWTAPITQRAGSQLGAAAAVDSLLAEVDRLRAAGGALIWTVHNVLAHEQRHRQAEVSLLRGLAHRADVIHVMQPHTARAVADVWQLPAERQVHIPHPSYLGVYPDHTTRQQARAALGVPADATAVLFHGLLRQYKGVAELVDGFLAAREERDDLHLLIAGRPGEGFAADWLAPLQGRDDVTLHIDYVPAEQVQLWHRAADALVMPYRAGLNSGALQLAATFDLPAIAFPCLAVEAAEDEGWAVVVDPAAPRWLLDGIAALPPDARERAAAAARRQAPEAIGRTFAERACDAVLSRPGPLDAGLVAVVVSFGSANLVERGLAPLLVRMRAVIVENPTTQDEHEQLVAVVRRLGAELTVMPRNVGFGAAVRAGVERARSLGAERVLLLNPDVTAHAAAVERLLERSREQPRAIVAPRIETPEGQLWFDGGVIDWERGIARHRGEDERDRPLDWLTGACLLLPIEVWDELGGFDDGYFLYWEDVDLTHRWSRRGALVLEREATVVHEVGATQGSGSKSLGYSYYNARNRMLFAVRHLGVRGALRWLRAAPGYASELVARSGAPDARAAEEHRAAASRGTRNGVLRGIERLVRRRPPTAD